MLSEILRAARPPGAVRQRGLVWCPVALGGLGPWAINRQLRISSGPGRFSCNGICSTGFALEHQIKSTSGIGVNGDARRPLTPSQSPWRPADQKASISSNPLSLGMAVSKHVGDRTQLKRGGSADSLSK